jgi:hypothetical protein
MDLTFVKGWRIRYEKTKLNSRKKSRADEQRVPGRRLLAGRALHWA